MCVSVNRGRAQSSVAMRRIIFGGPMVKESV